MSWLSDSDGKKKVETFVEEEKDVAKGGHDMFKNRIRWVLLREW